ncbi:ricin-type beta-trefoil lectin domain protein [Actinoplanes sp. NPDC051861]|uniref:ricin-type beta-trefoil lectin domain protein n=1 Tax=Actinoplanes sp. NPDC051861 TaxID=3155170 RepID=UPI0034493AA7
MRGTVLADPGGRRLRRARRALVLMLTTTLAVTSVPVQAWAVPGPGMDREDSVFELPPVPELEAEEPAEPAQVDLTTADEVAVDPYAPQYVEPWQPGSGTVDLTDVTQGGMAKVGELPIELGVPAGGDPAAVAGTWTVDLASPEVSQAADLAGLIMKITPPVTADPAAEVALKVDTTRFSDLYGPQAADRFGIMLLPDCAFDSPDTGDCASNGEAEPEDPAAAATFETVPSEVQLEPAPATLARAASASAAPERRVLSGNLSIAGLTAEDAASPSGTGGMQRAAAAAPTSGVVGVGDTGASSAGDYTATPLLSSGSWAAGSSSGAFTYGYQVQVPETAGGLVPKINLGYSSQSVDGRTSATNNQASWIGDGWDYNAGAITRTYANCRQDSKKEGSNNATHRTADMCWGSNNATLSLGGMTTELVWDEGKKLWFTANGDGSTIQLIDDDTYANDVNAANGDDNGEHWIVTTRDGTRYFFGRNRLPGWSAHGDDADDPVTDSVLTVPVYGNHDKEPCYKAGNWAGSHCYQAWRWSLDYVEDVHGNAMSLWWAREDNYYARNMNWKSPVKYHRGGYLTRIDYGQRAGALFTSAAQARVDFSVEQRCFAKGSLTCEEADFTSGVAGRYRSWYDTPVNLRCGKPTKDVLCWNANPSFFSRMRLDRITTSAQRLAGNTARQVVDEYQLKQDFPITRTGPNTALWLESITRTGFGRNGRADESIKLAPVRFEHNTEDMPNRVKNDNRPGFSRLRIGRVINEYGGETFVHYRQPEGQCATGTGLPDEDDKDELKANNRLCYPAFWHPDPAVEEIDWFHKYVVERVQELPATPNAEQTDTRYEYANPGWKLAEAEFTKKSTRTYSQFAGFEQVTVLTGPEGADRSKNVTRFYRGMGDTVPMRDVMGVEITKDREPFAGRIAEEITYAGAGAAKDDWLTRSITYPQAVELASRSRTADSLPPLKAWRVLDARQVTVTKSSGDGDDDRKERRLESRTSYDTVYGLPEVTESFGDVGKVGDESCAQFQYVHDVARNIIGLTKQVLSSATSCADAKFDNLATLSAANRIAYDGREYGAGLDPEKPRGLATKSYTLKADGTGFQLHGSTVFDAIGRVTSRVDPDERASTITYEPATGQAFRIREKNFLNHEQVTEVDPGRGTGWRTTDINGNVSEAAFDPMGRLRKAWAPGRAGAAVPDFEAVYTVVAGKPPYVTTKTRGHDNRIKNAVTIYDGLGRARQTQTDATGGGRLISDTLYNGSGEVWMTYNAYFVKGVPSGDLFTPDALPPNATRYTYDGLGRVVEEMPVLDTKDVPARATRYEYGKDWSSVINPAGTSSYRIYSDAMGLTSRVDTFTDTARTAYTSMRYEYDKRGQMVRATNSADTKLSWSWTYDRLGRQETATHPSTGTSRIKYDSYGRPETVTNARNITVWTGYDDLSRPDEQRLDSKDGTLLSAYSYDTAAGGKGLPATATRYTDGLAYTQAVGGYTNDYQPISTTLTLPSSVATTWGLRQSYTYNYTYTDTGLPDAMTVPAIGAFTDEKLLVRYNQDGMPQSVSGKDWYGSETVYSPYGQVLRSTLGAQPYRVWALADYDDASGALTRQQVYREKIDDKSVVGGNLVSQRSYGYDDAGNVTSITEAAVGIDERQCFNYDPIGQLTKAWTVETKTSCTAGPKNADGTVNTAAGKDNSGYWQEYEYDLLGNRTKLVEKNLGGNSAQDTTTEYTYGNAAQPQTLTKTREYVGPAGSKVTAEVDRLYEVTGETKTLTTKEGDKQELSWTYDGKVDRIAGQGTGGKTVYLGLANKCLDLKSSMAQAAQPIWLYTCNGGIAQKWRFTPTPGQSNPDLGSLSIHDGWCMQPAAGTVGSAFQLQKCDGGAAQQLRRSSTTNQLIHASSGLCAAVKDGATVDTTPIVLAACVAGTAAQQWEAQNETRHVYGPTGDRLLTLQGKERQATLHLGESEVTVLRGGALVNTQRTYGVPGGMVIRNAHASATPGLVAVVADHQGTPYAEVALGGTQEVRIRKQDPFGNQRGTAPIGMHMQTNDGFLGTTRDDASGFVALGARMYDPSVGRFLSADPIMDLADPLQSNGYAYAHNNPATLSDKTGLSVTLTASEMAAALAGVGLSAAQVAEAQANANRTLASVILSVAWDVLKDFIGLNDALSCFGGDLWACGSLLLDMIPWTKMAKSGARIIKAIDRTMDAIQAWRTAKKAAEQVLMVARAAEQRALQAKIAAIERAKKAAQAAQKKAAEKVNTISNKAAGEAKKTGNPAQKAAQSTSNPKASSVSSGGGKAQSGSGGKSGAAPRSDGGSSGGGGGGKGGDMPGSATGEPPPTDFAPNVVYRAIRADENPMDGLFSRGDGDVPPWQHIMANTPDSPWISTTRDPKVAFETYAANGGGVVRIDLTKIQTQMESVAGYLEVPKAYDFLGLQEMARKDAELLIRNHIPAEAITGFWAPGG